MNRKKKLREGFSTGACAAAAAKAATIALFQSRVDINQVELEFPDGFKRTLPIQQVHLESSNSAWASIIKDAGDDPDVTNGAQIICRVEILTKQAQDKGPRVKITGGPGVGVVTKPGLAVPVGEPAINPVPREMITHAVLSAMGDSHTSQHVQVTVCVPRGEELAKKTLNSRLGIVGGISILGTTGIVKPISEAAWCATISVSMDVALAVGLDQICLSTGRTSEGVAMELLGLREEAFISMGDYVGFSLREAAKRPFRQIYLACQWSKLVKMAMGWDQTHVRFGPLEPSKAIRFIEKNFGYRLHEDKVNTVRQLLSLLQRDSEGKRIIYETCKWAHKRLCDNLTDNQNLVLILVSYEKSVLYTIPPLEGVKSTKTKPSNYDKGSKG